jgi:hypothetical protein
MRNSNEHEHEHQLSVNAKQDKQHKDWYTEEEQNRINAKENTKAPGLHVD